MSNNNTLRVLDIMPGTSVDGPGLRTSIYLAGCSHHCLGCHNPQSWDFDGGNAMTIPEIMEVVEENGFNVTLSGGDPLMQLPAVTELASALSSAGYRIWLYTGYTFEQVLRLPNVERLLVYVDVIVDGPFVESLRDISLQFRGSSNQRLIDVARSLQSGETTLYDCNF